jgi:CHRD domain
MFQKFRTILFMLLLFGICSGYSQILFTVALNGDNEVPAVTTNATGTAWAVLSPDMTSLTYHITYAQLDSTFTVSHFHIGKAGVNGGVIFLHLMEIRLPEHGTTFPIQ